MEYIRNLYKGRISRLRLLGGTLFFRLIGALASLLIVILFGDENTTSDVLMLFTAITVAVFDWALVVRRAHDLGKSGWFALVNLIPFAILYFLFAKGNPGPNEYGEEPTDDIGFIDDIFNTPCTKKGPDETNTQDTIHP